MKRITISEQLRQAIEESGKSRYWLSQQTGIPQSVLSRFVVGGAFPSMGTADKLAEVLGLELRKTRKGK